MRPPKKIKCPTCRSEGDWLDGPYGPFCSRRCKLVDLGRWFNEEHLISGPLRQDNVESVSELARTRDQTEPSN